MPRAKYLAIASLSIMFPCTLHAEPRCPASASSLTLHPVQDALIVVPVQINHTGPYDFLVDTGAQIVTIDPSLALELHLKSEGTTGLSGVATHTRSAFAYLDLIEAGSQQQPSVLAVIQDIAELKEADPDIRGILGENFLAHFDLLIDNRQKILCLDRSGTLAPTITGKHIPLAQPHGAQGDLPFMRPIIVAVRLHADDDAPVLLRLDSGSNAAVLYAVPPHLLSTSTGGAQLLKRRVNGIEQAFAVLPAQDILVGACPVRQVSFVVPMNAIGIGPNPREEGVLPTIAFEYVFISYSDNYAVVDSWPH